ncbi:MAG: hypothetical protein SVK44_01340 [Nitrospirota bacterium]|nr:hypothetical protein [Nitrospirota bacterium]
MPQKRVSAERDHLNARDEDLLRQLVELHTTAGRAIGSKVLSERTGEGGLSPSSIRNAMAKLKKEGYVSQRHPSGGRIPTVKAYRYYADHLLQPRKPSPAMLRRLENGLSGALNWNEGGGDFLMLSRVLATLSNQAGIVALKPPSRKPGLTIAEGMSFEGRAFYAFLEHMLKNPLAFLGSMPLKAVGLEMNRWKASLLLSVTETSHIQGGEGELAVFWEGIGNLAMTPEFGSTEGLRQLFEMLEERERIGEALIQAIQARKQRVEVLFSRLDLGLRWKTELSYVVSTHASKEAGDVVIGVVGPIRMDYASVVPFVAHVAGMLEERTAITLKRGFS